MSELVKKMYEDEYLTFEEIAAALCQPVDYILQLYAESQKNSGL